MSTESFVQERLAIEGLPSDLDSNNIGTASALASYESDKSLSYDMDVSSITSQTTVPTPDMNTITATNFCNVKCAASAAAIVSHEGIPSKQTFGFDQMPQSAKKLSGKSEATKAAKTNIKIKLKSNRHGRSGDPRMTMAVQAKLDNPDMPLVDALVEGGFVFPELDAPGVKISNVKDTDNVTVYQRRNQLMRRLRLLKK